MKNTTGLRQGKGLNRSIFSVLVIAALISGFFAPSVLAFVGVTVTQISGGINISIDTTSAPGGTEAWTPLSGPIIQENAVGEVSEGVHTFTLPAGWEFDTSRNVTIGVNGTTDLSLSNQVVTPEADNTFSFNVSHISTVGHAPARLTVDGNFYIRPTGTVVPASVNITHSGPFGATIAGVTDGPSGTNFGTISAVPGAAAKIKVETLANGTGIVVPAQDLNSGSGTLTAYSIRRDQFDNFIDNFAATWSLTGNMGGVVDGDLSPDSGLNTIFTAHKVGTATIHAVAGSLIPNDSGTITVHPVAPGTPAYQGFTPSHAGYINASENSAGFTIRVTGLGGAIAGDTLDLLLNGSTLHSKVLDVTDISRDWVDFNIAHLDLGLDGSKSLTSRITTAIPSEVQTSTSALSFTLDTTAPAVNITAPLAADVVNALKVITFTGTEAETTPECSVDNTNWHACTTGVTTLGGLAEFAGSWQGTFTLFLRDTDPVGNIGTDSEVNIIKDTEPPAVPVIASPVADSVSVVAPTLTFTPSDSATATTCSYSIDGGAASSPVSCTSGVVFNTTISGLLDGGHGRHSVVAIVADAAGNSSSSLPISFVFNNDQTLTVDDTPANNPDFATIQAAINVAATGDTISVAVGNYIEQINITKPLTLSGAGMTSTHIVSPSPASMIIYDAFGFGAATGPSPNPNYRYIGRRGSNIPVIRIAASNVIIEGIHVSMNNYQFLDVKGSYGVNYNRGTGILVDHTETVLGTPDVFTGVTIRNNKVDGMLVNDKGDAIKVLGSATATIQGNTIYAYGESGVNAQAIDSPRAAFYPTVTANSNIIYGGTIRSDSSNFFGIGYWSGATGSADGNTIYNSPNNVSGYALNVWTPRPVSLTNNTITTDGGAIGGNGAQLYESSNLVFSNNIIEKQGLVGAIWSNPVITITNNTITDSTDGFLIDHQTLGSVTINTNSITGIASGHYAVKVGGTAGASSGTIWGNWEGPSTVTIDATNNWWGSNQRTTIQAEISSNVNFTPWYLSNSLIPLSLNLLSSSDVAGPTVVLTNSISGRTQVRDADTVLITATFSDLNGLDTGVTPTISISGTTVSGATMSGSGNVWTYSWDVPVGDTAATVSVSAKDIVGNDNQTATGVKNYTIDNTPPVIAVHLGETAEATSAVGAVVIYTSPATTDAVDGAGVATCLPSSGSTFPLGDTTVTCSAQDTAGNSAINTTFNIHVQDTIAPTIDSVTPIVAEATSTAGATVTITPPMSHDAVDGDLASSCDHSTGTFPIGTTTVTCNKTDAAGNIATLSVFTVIVQDTTPPMVNAGVDNDDARALFTQDATATDGGSGIASYAWTQTSGPGTITFGTPAAEDTTVSATLDGVYTIRLTVTDNASNSAYDEATVIWDAAMSYVSSSPSDSAVNVSIADGTATITFSRNIYLVNAGKVDLVVDSTGVSHKTSVAIQGGDGGSAILQIPYAGLVNSTLYRINILPGAVRDTNGNLNQNVVLHFMTVAATPDTVPPTITFTSATPAQTGADIVFKSNETGFGWIRYGLGTDYGNQSETVPLTASINRTVSLTGLTCATTYHYKLYARDSSGNEASEIDRTLSTNDCASAVIPTIVLNDAAINSAYSATEANTRFASGLQFTVTNDHSVTVNGVIVVPDAGVVTAATNVEATTLGAHTYNVVVTSSTGNTAEITVSYQVNADNVAPIYPTITLDGDTIVSAYTQTEADIRFASDLTFMVTDALSATVNGTSATIDADKITIAKTDAITVGAHSYDVIVTSTTGHQASLNVTYQVNSDSDTTLPLITPDEDSVQSVTATSADIVFQSDENGMAKVHYGTTEAYGSVTVYQPVMADEDATISLAGLTCGTTYHYSIYAKDASGNEANTTDTTFDTSACADTTPPVINSISLDKPAYKVTQDASMIVTVVADGTESAVTINGTDAISSGLGTWTLTFDHGQSSAGLYSFNVVATDSVGNATTQTVYYEVIADDAAPAPTVSITAPGPGETVSGSAYVIFSSSGGPATTYRVSIDGGGWTDASSPYSLDTPSLLNSSHTVRVSATDGSTGYSDYITFLVNNTSVDTTPPVISSIHPTSIGQTSININWQTDEDSDTLVEYGLTSEYGHTSSTINSVTSHMRSLSGLSAGTTYHYRVRSRDASENLATSNDYVFTTAINDTAVLAVTNISTTRAYATAGGDFSNGWQWIFSVTVPTSETNLQMKFDDWLNADGVHSIPVNGNMQFYSVQSSDHTSANPVAITSNDYGTALTLNGDLDSTTAGRQIQITVEVQVPAGSAGGSYSTSYGVRTSAI